jgi:hypothetical protein
MHTIIILIITITHPIPRRNDNDTTSAFRTYFPFAIIIIKYTYLSW